MASDLINNIRQTEKKFRLLFDNNCDAVWVLDLQDLKFLYASNEVTRILGYAPEEVTKLTPANICTPNCMRRAMSTLKKEMAKLKQGENGTVRIQTEFIKSDGSTVTTAVDWRLLEEKGRVRALGILRDPKIRNEAREVEDEIQQQLKNLMAERDRLRWEVKILQGLLPICSNCKNIRDENGKWTSLEEYVQSHSEANFTHTVCPPCQELLYPDLM